MASAPLLPAGVLVLERGWLSSNNILVRGATEAALVDSGYGSHAGQTVELVDRSVGELPLTTLVNTHLHSDHCGGNAALQARWPQLCTLIPPGLAGAVRDWDEVALSYAPTGQLCPRFAFDATLQPGGAVRLGDLAWQVHAAPGHDVHSVILFEPVSRTLISADALWENGFGVVFRELEGDQAFDDVGATLDLIERLAPAVVIPGHGSAFTDVGGALARARRRLEAYVANPARHASHAAKVLLKFKLLELQSAARQDFVAWAHGTAYFTMVWMRWFASVEPHAWLETLLDQLVQSGAAAVDGERITNA
jgi:glyoxylase-like metal-dependent hydrolase (beta-lactamase superfamily II)